MKFYVAFFIAGLIFYAGCAPRFAERRNVDRSQHEAMRQSIERIQALERNNRDYRRNRLFRPISAYLGTPYQLGGNTRRGMDCSGFVFRIFWESYQVKLPRSASQQFRQCATISFSELRLGDLLFFDIDGDGSIGHVGIYLGDNFFAHASTSAGVIISSLNEPHYRTTFLCAGRIRQ